MMAGHNSIRFLKKNLKREMLSLFLANFVLFFVGLICLFINPWLSVLFFAFCFASFILYAIHSKSLIDLFNLEIESLQLENDKLKEKTISRDALDQAIDDIM